jgi:exopolysaccharide production protein ExoZ
MMAVVHHTLKQLNRHGSIDIHTGVGQAGVDIFFVISGFVMVYVSRDRTPLAFWRDRIRRIVPLYWFYTLLMALLALVVPGLLRTAEFDAEHLAQSLLFIPAYHPTKEWAVWPVLVQGWTLNYEMFFYAVFGALLTLRRLVPALAVAFVALVAAGAILNPQGAVASVYTNPLLLEFLAGALIGRAYLAGLLPGRAGGWACLGLALVIFALPLPRIIGWGVPAALIVIAAVTLETGRANPHLRLLGDASYSIYLSHTFTLGVIGAAWIGGSAVGDIASVGFGIAASVVVGVLSFRLVETPLNRLVGHPVSSRALRSP